MSEGGEQHIMVHTDCAPFELRTFCEGRLPDSHLSAPTTNDVTLVKAPLRSSGSRSSARGACGSHVNSLKLNTNEIL